MFIDRRFKMLLLLPGLMAVVVAGVSCSKNFVEPEVVAETSTENRHKLDTSVSVNTDGEVGFHIPEGWVEQVPSSSMRKAQYLLPRAEGDAEDGELIVFHFPGQGGSIKSNISRWVGQISRPDGSPAAEDAKISKKQVRGKEVTLLDISGTYRKSMGPLSQGAPKSGFRMLGAIVGTKRGPWFFKLTGPAVTVAKWFESWEKFVESFQVK